MCALVLCCCYTQQYARSNACPCPELLLLLLLQNAWDDALRVAKVYGGVNASKQVRAICRCWQGRPTCSLGSRCHRTPPHAFVLALHLRQQQACLMPHSALFAVQHPHCTAGAQARLPPLPALMRFAPSQVAPTRLPAFHLASCRRSEAQPCTVCMTLGVSQGLRRQTVVQI